MFPSMLRRLAALLASVALLLAAFPGVVSAAAAASITGAFAPLGTCQIDSDGQNGSDPCLQSDKLLFNLTVSNTGAATLTHVQLTAPLTAAGATGPAEVVAAGTNGALTGVPCETTTDVLSCSVAELPSGSELGVVLAFDPADTPKDLETVTYTGSVSVTAKASTKAGSKSNFALSRDFAKATPPVEATFLLSEQDADRTDSHHAGTFADGQETTVTLPEKPAGIFAFVQQLAVTRGDANDFCGDPALTLNTCFGLAVHVEVETAQGGEHVFAACDLTSDSRASTCLSIEIMWNPDTIEMSPLYPELPLLITAYDHGNPVDKCTVIALTQDPADDNRACSTDATTITSGDYAGWIVMTIYSASNGNWGAG